MKYACLLENKNVNIVLKLKVCNKRILKNQRYVSVSPVYVLSRTNPWYGLGAPTHGLGAPTHGLVAPQNEILSRPKWPCPKNNEI